jgi:hypothetical protein
MNKIKNSFLNIGFRSVISKFFSCHVKGLEPELHKNDAVPHYWIAVMFCTLHDLYGPGGGKMVEIVVLLVCGSTTGTHS